MKTIYKFGMELDNDSSNWSEQFSTLFNINFSNISIVNEFSNKEKNWYETYSNLDELKAERLFCGHYLKMIKLGFNRYQEYVYFSFVFNGVIDDFSSIKDFIRQNVSGFRDTFEIPFKEADLYADYSDKQKYSEFLKLVNPNYICSQDEFDDFLTDDKRVKYKEHQGVDVSFWYTIAYDDQQKKNRYPGACHQLIKLLNILTIKTMILKDIFKVPVPVIH